MKKLFAIAYVLILIVGCKKEERSTIDPNIVLIMADDLGYGDLACFGNPSIHTPNLDQLASGGVRFTDFHSNGAICSPTRAALMTGKYQQRTGVEGVISAKNHRKVGLNLDEITLAEELKKYGYLCALFGKWHLGYASEFNPTWQGFDQFRGFVSGNVDYHGHIDQEGYLDWWKDREIVNEKGYTTDLITDYGASYIRKYDSAKTGKPFFLYLAHEAPHYPYQRRIDSLFRKVGVAQARRTLHKDSIAAIYKEMVEILDEGVGNVVQALKETSQYNNTIVLFLSDNGANREGSNGILRGYKADAYEGGSRVPAILSYPDKIKGGQINHEVILTMDVLPTLLDFIGQKPTENHLDGISVKDNLLFQKELPIRDVFFAFKNRRFIRRGDWKLIHTQNDEEAAIELYDLSNDIREQHNVVANHPELTSQLSEQLVRWDKQVREGVEVVSN